MNSEAQIGFAHGSVVPYVTKGKQSGTKLFAVLKFNLWIGIYLILIIMLTVSTSPDNSQVFKGLGNICAE